MQSCVVVGKQKKVTTRPNRSIVTVRRWTSGPMGNNKLPVPPHCHMPGCSVLYPPEAPCERIGSIMRALWEPSRKLTAKLLEDLVLLSGSGVRCTGSERDEALVQTVVHLLQATSKKTLWASCGGLPPLHAQLQQRDCSDSGRFAEGSGGGIQIQPSDLGLGVGYDAKRDFVRGRRAAGTPSGLPEAALRGIRASMGARGSVVPLPLDVPALHAMQKHHAGSGLRAKAVSWLESDAGKEWLNDRKKLFGEEEAERGGESPSGKTYQGGQGSASPLEDCHTERPRAAPKKKAPRKTRV